MAATNNVNKKKRKTSNKFRVSGTDACIYVHT